MKKTVVILISILLSIGFGLDAFAIEFDEFDELGGIDIHGFISQGYLKSDENRYYADTKEGTAKFSEVGINFGTDATDRLHLGTQLFARQFGDFGHNEVVIDWAVADFHFYDFASIRGGKMKFVHGLYNQTRDIDFLRTQIFLPNSVYNESWRDTMAAIQGAELYGDISASVLGSFSYQAQAGVMSVPTDSGVALSAQEQLLVKGFNYDLTSINVTRCFSGGTQWYTPLEGLKFGGTAYDVEMQIKGNLSASRDTKTPLPESITGVRTPLPYTIIPKDMDLGERYFNVRVFSWVASTEFSWENLTIAAEAWQSKYDFAINLTPKGGKQRADYTIDPNEPDDYKKYKLIFTNDETKTDLTTLGYYFSFAYRLFDWLEAGYYYSEYYPDADDKNGTRFTDVTGLTSSDPDKVKDAQDALIAKSLGWKDHDAWIKDHCVSMRFDVNENWAIKIESHLFNGTAQILKYNNPNVGTYVPTSPTAGNFVHDENHSQREEDWWMLAFKTTFSF